MMLEKITESFHGSVTLRIESRYENGFLRMLLSEKIPAKVYELTENGEKIGIGAVISPKFLKIISSSLDKYSIKVYIINIQGFCTLIPILRQRIGLTVGTVLFFALVWLSSLFIWRIDVVGAEAVSEEKLRYLLSESGVSAGATVSDIDAFSVSNALLLSCPELSWASLQLTGTTATLTVRETVNHQETEKNKTSLLIASESGVIESVLVYDGAAAVKVGCVVKKGDVLINGLISGSGLQYTDQPILRIGNADGSVKALVERTFSVTVPYRETELIPKENGRVYKGRSINVFGGGFYIGDRKPSADCYSVTESQNTPTVFGVALPVTVSETVWSEMTEREIVRTSEEAETLARARAEERLSAELGTDEIRATEYVVAVDEERETVTVTVTYRCVTEITASAEIYKND